MSKKYEDLSKEELLKKLSEFEKELKNKKYGLVWENEKFPEQVVLDCENNLPVLEYVKERELKTQNYNEDYNILIEGDNYHALTVLNYTHENKIDVIYIDPPYNTGNKDFIYNDNYVDKEDSYRHSKWLNFMEKRLKLAKNLLKEDGVIFISIDDNEQAQLKLLCDKIFGEENFVSQIIWKKTENIKMDSKYISGNTEYILCYKGIERKSFNKQFSDIERFNLEDKKGKYYLRKLDSKSSTYSKGMDYVIEYDGVKYYAGGSYEKYLERQKSPKAKDSTWLWSKNKYLEGLENGEIIFKNGNIYNKVRYDGIAKKPYISLITEFSQQTGQKEFEEIFGARIFDHPKPRNMIKKLLSMTVDKNSTILDFFAGSGTTGHAVLELNKEDSGNRKFILCTNNQNNICEEVTYKRLEKVMNGYNKNGDGEFIAGLGGKLKYFKTSLIKKSKSRSQLKIDITQKCTEMLCLKESIFDEIVKSENYKIFTNIKKDKHLVIYYNFLSDDFGDFIEELKKLNAEIIVYIFSVDNSVDNSVDKSLFKGLDVKIEAIPQKILEVYKSLMRV